MTLPNHTVVDLREGGGALAETWMTKAPYTGSAPLNSNLQQSIETLREGASHGRGWKREQGNRVAVVWLATNSRAAIEVHRFGARFAVDVVAPGWTVRCTGFGACSRAMQFGCDVLASYVAAIRRYVPDRLDAAREAARNGTATRVDHCELGAARGVSEADGRREAERLRANELARLERARGLAHDRATDPMNPARPVAAIRQGGVVTVPEGEHAALEADGIAALQAHGTPETAPVGGNLAPRFPHGTSTLREARAEQRKRERTALVGDDPGAPPRMAKENVTRPRATPPSERWSEAQHQYELAKAWPATLREGVHPFLDGSRLLRDAGGYSYSDSVSGDYVATCIAFDHTDYPKAYNAPEPNAPGHCHRAWAKRVERVGDTVCQYGTTSELGGVLAYNWKPGGPLPDGDRDVLLAYLRDEYALAVARVALGEASDDCTDYGREARVALLETIRFVAFHRHGDAS